MKKSITILLLSSLLFGCGFHLNRHTGSLHKKLPVLILPPSGSHTFYQAFHRTLTSASIQVLESASSQKAAPTAPTLLIQSQSITTQPLVYGADAELRRERLTMTITFSLSDPIKETSRSFELSTARDRQLDNTQFLGNNAEKILIKQEMQADIIAQLIRFLAMEQT